VLSSSSQCDFFVTTRAPNAALDQRRRARESHSAFRYGHYAMRRHALARAQRARPAPPDAISNHNDEHKKRHGSIDS